MVRDQSCQLVSDYKMLAWVLLSFSLGPDSEPLQRVTEKREWERGDEEMKGQRGRLGSQTGL